MQQLELLDSSQHDRWDQFVLSQGQGTLFHTAWWHRAWGMEPVVNALLGDAGEIEGGVSFCRGRRFGATALVRPPMSPRNGPVFRLLDNAAKEKSNSHAKNLLLAAIQSLPQLGLYDFILRPRDTDIMPFLWNGFDSLVTYTYVIPCSEKDRWQEHATRSARWSMRRAARAAMEKGYQIDIAPSFEEVLELIRQTAESKEYSLAQYSDRMPSWWNVVTARGAGQAYAIRDEQGIARFVTLTVRDNTTVYYLAGGISREWRKGLPLNALLIQRMVDDAHQMGLDFDFEGSTLPGVERFFRSFGGELRGSYRVVKIPSLTASLLWQGHRWWTRHRKRSWIWPAE